MTRQVRRTIAVLALAAASASVAFAADTNMKDFMKARHDHYHKLGDAFKTLRDQTRASSPDMTRVKAAAQVVKQASVDQYKLFPKGSGPEAGKTRAKAEIWTDPAGFEAAQKNFAAQAPKFAALADAGDVKGVQQQFRALGKTCADCHDKFRAEEDHKH